MEIVKDESGTVLKIEGALDIGVAEELHKALLESLDDRVRMLDLSGVESCDTAALQLLCAARKTGERQGNRLRFAGISAAVANSCTALGLPLEELAAESEEESRAV
jgi:anti-anti-sigma factor